MTYFDLETDGLYDEVTTVWCIGHTINGIPEVFHGDYKQTYEFIDEQLFKCETLVGHNIINYDIPVIKKLFGLNYKGEVIDTWLLSRMLCADRHSHSLRAWGTTLGFPKGDHDDWSQLSPEMIKYCKQDVEVTMQTHKELQRRIGKYEDIHR